MSALAHPPAAHFHCWVCHYEINGPHHLVAAASHKHLDTHDAHIEELVRRDEQERVDRQLEAAWGTIERIGAAKAAPGKSHHLEHPGAWMGGCVICVDNDILQAALAD